MLMMIGACGACNQFELANCAGDFEIDDFGFISLTAGKIFLGIVCGHAHSANRIGYC